MEKILTYGEKAMYPFIFESDYNGMGSINCYLYKNGSDYTLIDAGIRTKEFEQFFFEKLNDYQLDVKQINRIILTHFHGDHIGMVSVINALHKIPVYASAIAIPRLKCEDSYLQQKLAFYYELYAQYNVTDLSTERMEKMKKTLHNKEQVMIHSDILVLEEEQKIAGLEVIAAPGHSPDSICLYDGETGWLFAGDFLLASGITSALIDHDEWGKLTNPMEQYIDSIRRIKKLSIQDVFAGHQAPFQNIAEVMDNSLNKMEYKLQKVVTKIAEGNNTARKLGEAIYGPRFEKFFVFTISEVIGLTILAEKRGLIVGEWQDEEWCFTVASAL